MLGLIKKIHEGLNRFTTRQQKRHKEIMTALETIQASVDKNGVAILAAIAKLNTPAPGDNSAELLALAATLDQNTQNLVAATNPPSAGT